MKRKFVKRAGALLLTAAMLTGALAGCGGSKTTDAGASTDQAAAETGGEAGAAESSIVNKEGLPIVNEPVTFTIAVRQTSPLKSAAERECVLKAEKETGIHIEWMEIPQSGWEEKINILFSTDSLPDAILGGIDVAKYYEQLAPWDEYMEAGYTPSVSAFFETRDDYPGSLIAPDGKIRCMPIGDESYTNTIDSTIFVNRDWLKALNLEMPTTPAEFKDMLIAFRDQDPNGNGQKDEIPFTFMNLWSWANAMENFFGPWGVVENSAHVFLKDDNKVVFSPEEQGYYECLAYMNDLYKEGLLDKDIFTMSTEQYDAKGAVGDVVGVHINYSGEGCGVDNGDPDVYDNDRYIPLPLLKGEDGTQMVCRNNAYPGDNFLITNKCKNPEALMRWYDYINSSVENIALWNRGPAGVYYEIVEENGKQHVNWLPTDASTWEEAGYKNKGEFRQAESLAAVAPSLWRQDIDLACTDAVEKKNYKKEWIEASLPHAVRGLPTGMSSDPKNEERRVILLTDIDTYLRKFAADSIINGIDDAKWEQHLKTLGDLKCDEYKQLCQEYVDDITSR